jgi:hypothetical protein
VKTAFQKRMMAVHESRQKVRDTAFWHLQALEENSLTPLSSRHQYKTFGDMTTLK